MDQAQEFANGIIKPGLEDSSQESINDYVTRISAIKEVEEPLMVALKKKSLADPSFFSKSTRVEPADVKHLVQRFEETLGKTWTEFAAKKSNPFGTNYTIATRRGGAATPNTVPWNKVDNERVSASLKKYIQSLTQDGGMPVLYDDDGIRLDRP